MTTVLFGGLVIAFALAIYKWLETTTREMPRVDPR